MIMLVLKGLRRKSWNVTAEVKCKIYEDVHTELRWIKEHTVKQFEAKKKE